MPSHAEEPSRASRGPVRDWLAQHPSVPWFAIPGLIYAVLVVAGVTQTSIGVSQLRQDPANPLGWQLGVGRPIRSDEFLFGTPPALSVAVTGSTDDFNPLTFGPGVFGGAPHGLFSSLLLFDRTLLRLGTLLPVSSVFAAYWWLPTLVLAIALPLWGKLVMGNRWLGLFATVLIYFNPANFWWSYTPGIIAAYSAAGCVLLILGCQQWARRRYWQGALILLPAALFLARTAFAYQPWTIVILPGLLVPTVLALWADRETRKSQILPVLLGGVLTIGWLATAVVQGRAELAALAGTVYPGSRREAGFPSSVGTLFGAPALFDLSRQPIDPATNQSEISTGFLILVLLVLVLAVAGLRFATAQQRWAWIGVLVICAIWFAWCMVYTGAAGSHIPVLNLVSPYRARQALGELVPILLCLTLAAAPSRGARATTVLGTCIIMGVQAWSASDLRVTYLPSVHVIIPVVAVGVVGFLLLRRPGHWAGYIVASVLAVASVAIVNPIVIGLGDLEHSTTAQYFRAEGATSRTDGTLWASDNLFLGAVMQASGVPMINGLQLAPDKAAWQSLDAVPADSSLWNRGATHIQVDWNSASSITLSNPTPDSLVISTSPCALHAALPTLTMITSSHPLGDACVTLDRTVEWSGKTQYIYKVSSG